MLLNKSLRAEREILSSWRTSELLVSVLCTTYNQEQYIADAIRGFLIQETTFPFEMIIHDDASTDDTRKIISTYESMYPRLIKPIYSAVNLFGTNKQGPFLNCLHKATGKYAAVCEGDDFWCDPLKLQIQVEAMEAHEDVVMSFHPTHYLNGTDLSKTKSNGKYEVQKIAAKKIISSGGGFCPTVSIMFKRQFLLDLPDWYSCLPIGDYYLQSLAAAVSGAIRISQPMSVYRRHAHGGFTTRLTTSALDSQIQHAYALIDANKLLERKVGAQYHKDIARFSGRLMIDLSSVCLRAGHFGKFFACVFQALQISGTLFPAVLFDALRIRIARNFRKYVR